MNRNRWIILIAVLAVAGAAVSYWRGGGSSATAIDLTQALAAAEKRSNPLPADEAVKLVPAVTINGEAKPAILEQSNARIIFRITPPPDAWFSASLALDPAAWDKEGNGVLFRAGVSDGKKYQELLNQYVNPFSNTGDRRWIPVSLDLSAYSGQPVELILNVNDSLPKQPPDLRNDLALWGAPTVHSGR